MWDRKWLVCWSARAVTYFGDWAWKLNLALAAFIWTNKCNKLFRVLRGHRSVDLCNLQLVWDILVVRWQNIKYQCWKSHTVTFAFSNKKWIWSYLLLLSLRWEIHGVVCRGEAFWCGAKWRGNAQVHQENKWTTETEVASIPAEREICTAFVHFMLFLKLAVAVRKQSQPCQAR